MSIIFLVDSFDVGEGKVSAADMPQESFFFDFLLFLLEVLLGDFLFKNSASWKSSLLK